MNKKILFFIIGALLVLSSIEALFIVRYDSVLAVKQEDLRAYGDLIAVTCGCPAGLNDPRLAPEPFKQNKDINLAWNIVTDA